ncbi:hypothetical protein D3C74_401500 [compost metagenome]
MRSLAKEHGKGILLTSHYLQEVEELCDRVYVLNRGRLLLCDKPDAIVRQVAGLQTAHLQVSGWNEALRPLLQEHLDKLGHPAELIGGVKDIDGIAGSQDGDSYRISVRSTSADMLITELLPWTAQYGLRINSFACDKPNLEDAIILLSEGRVS